MLTNFVAPGEISRSIVFADGLTFKQLRRRYIFFGFILPAFFSILLLINFYNLSTDYLLIIALIFIIDFLVVRSKEIGDYLRNKKYYIPGIFNDTLSRLIYYFPAINMIIFLII